jgi:hypothetical protein
MEVCQELCFNVKFGTPELVEKCSQSERRAMASQKKRGSPGMCDGQHFFGALFFCCFSLEKQRKVSKHHHPVMSDQTVRRR